jgi:hypothetical protein
MKTPTAQDDLMAKASDLEAQKKRIKIQTHFWNIVGTSEHINVPKLEDVIRKEFHTTEDRFIQAQVRLMQTEGRIKVQNNVKVWIKQPPQ